MKSIISLDKLNSFVQSKGISVEIEGGLFALNIKQQILNEESEYKVVSEMVGLIHQTMQESFNYTIKSGDPKSADAINKDWEIPLSVTAICNENIDLCANYLIKTLSAISLSTSEVETYKSLNKNVYELSIKYLGSKTNKIFNFRKINSINTIQLMIANYMFYTSNFLVQCGVEEFTVYQVAAKYSENYKFNLEYIGYEIQKESDKVIYISFPSAGQVVGTFLWNDKKTLKQIEQIKGYSVKPIGIISKFNHGGYVVQEPIEAGYRIGINVDSKNVIKNLVSQAPASTSGIILEDKLLTINGSPVIGNAIDQIKEATKEGKILFLEIERENQIFKFNIMPKLYPSVKGLVLAPFDFFQFSYLKGYNQSWFDATKAASESNLIGYNDWRLPSLEEFKSLNYYLIRAAGLNNKYWSSTSENSGWAYGFGLNYNTSQSQKPYPSQKGESNYYARAIRSF